MHVPGLPRLTQLSHPAGRAGTDALLLGGDDAQAEALCRNGWQVARHALDTGPLAQRPGVPFTPPVVTWPFPDGAFDVVLLLDELALTVREEEALAEAARVLRPGGALILRVPATGRLAWLDGFNAYRYFRETTGRGSRLRELAGVGWRRHYPREDLRNLLRPHFAVREMRASGVGLTDAVRLALTLFWRWALRSHKGDAAITRVPREVSRLEGAWSVAGRGYSLVVVAERLAEPPDGQG